MSAIIMAENFLPAKYQFRNQRASIQIVPSLLISVLYTFTCPAFLITVFESIKFKVDLAFFSKCKSKQ